MILEEIVKKLENIKRVDVLLKEYNDVEKFLKEAEKHGNNYLHSFKLEILSLGYNEGVCFLTKPMKEKIIDMIKEYKNEIEKELLEMEEFIVIRRASK